MHWPSRPRRAYETATGRETAAPRDGCRNTVVGACCVPDGCTGEAPDNGNKCWLILGKYNLDMLVLTCGVNGSYVFTPGEMSYQETPRVTVADTVGTDVQ